MSAAPRGRPRSAVRGEELPIGLGIGLLLLGLGASVLAGLALAGLIP